MTRTVRDAALMLDAIAGPDDRDRYSIPADAGPSFLESCDAGIAGLSIAWSADLGHGTVDPEVLDLCAQAAERFESLGCHVEVVTPTWDNPEEVFRVLAAAEKHAAWGDHLDDGAEQLDRSLVALLRFGRGITIEQYMRASQARHDLWTDVQRFLARFDLLITPTVAVPPFEVGRPAVKEIAGREVGPLGWIPFTYPFNLTGRRPRSPSASPRRDCPWGFRSSAGAMATGPCSPPPRPSRPLLRGRIRSRASTERLAGSTGGCTELATRIVNQRGDGNGEDRTMAPGQYGVHDRGVGGRWRGYAGRRRAGLSRQRRVRGGEQDPEGAARDGNRQRPKALPDLCGAGLAVSNSRH